MSTAAMAADIVTVVGVTEFEIPAIDIPAGGDTRNAKPVAIAPTVALVLANELPKNDAAPKIRAKTASVSVGTVARPEYAGAFEFGSFPAEGKKGELRDLTVTVDRAKLPDPLTYVVKVVLFRDGDPSVTPQSFDLRFTRPAAAVSVAPLRLENTRYFPLLGVSTLSPGGLKLQETSRRATLTNVQIQVKDYLKGPDDFVIPVQLQPTMIDRIDAGKEATTQLGFAGNVPLGSTRGTLIVRAQQLAQPFEVAIEIVTHTARFWLLFTIVLSIIGGYLFRTAPEKRRAENQSRLAAEQQFGQIKQLQGNAVDPDVRSKLQNILDTLKAAIEAEPFVAATLDAAVKKAVDDTDVVMKDAETARAALRSSVKDLRGKLDSPDGQPPMVAQAVSGLIARLEAQDRALKSGAVTSVETELDKIGREIQDSIPDTIAQWAERAHAALAQMGQWQGLEFETTRKTVFDDSDPSKSPAIDLAKTRELARKLRIFVLGAGLVQATDLAGQVLDQLNGLNLADLKPKLDGGRTALDEVQKLTNVTIAQLPEVAQRLEKLRAALVDAFRTAAKLAHVVEPDGLDAGDFAKAMVVLSKSLQPKEKALGPGQTVPPKPSPIQVTSTDSFVSAAAAQPAAPAWWDLKLDAPVNPVAGEPAVATVTVIGTRPGAIDVDWTIGNSVQHSGVGNQSFIPTVPGALAISVRGVARATGESRMTSAVIQVRPQHGFSVVTQLGDQLAKDELTQSIVSGFFIAVAGYAIFQGAWSGTFLDFLGAALWGFSVDIGAAKVREIASPLLSRPLPLPAPKQ
jgi:hypothetical protein